MTYYLNKLSSKKLFLSKYYVLFYENILILTYMNKDIIHNFNLFFDNIKINKLEKNILYLFLIEKLRNIYNKIIKNKNLCKKNSTIKIDNNFFVLFNNYIANYEVIYTKKQVGGLNLILNNRILEDYITSKTENTEISIINFLLEKINYLKKIKNNKYSLLKKTKNIDSTLINYINTLLELDKINNENENKNTFFINFENEYLDKIIIDYFKTYKKNNSIDILRLINNINNICANTNKNAKYNIYIYVKFLYQLFHIKKLENNNFIKKMVFLTIIIYGLILLDYSFKKMNSKNCNFLYYYLILYMSISNKK